MNSFGFISRVLIAACAVLGLLPASASAVTITVAPSLETEYGDVFLGAGTVTGHFQQVYASGAFGASGPLSINELRFRPRMANSFSIVLSDVAISLATTSISPGGLSSTLASNLGGGASSVYSGALALSSMGTSGTPENDFDLVVALQTPFVYDPANGSLLLDWQSLGTVATDAGFVNFDALYTEGADPFSGMLAPNAGDSLGSTLAGGLVTQFEANSVVEGGVIPEPTGFLLFACGSLLVIARRR